MQPRNRITWFVELFERNSGLAIHAAGLLTLLLIIPLLLMAPDENASADPSGEVFDLRDDLDDRFQSLIHGTSFLVESRNGDMLTQAALWELYQNTQRLLRADERGELAPDGLTSQRYLYEAFDLDTNRPVVGVTSIADAVQRVLLNDPRFGVSLENATDGQVKSVISQLLLNPQTSGLADSLSVNAKTTELDANGQTIAYWESPALVFNVLADNERLGGGTLNIGVGGGGIDQSKEQFNRNVQEILRGDEQTYRLWGIAIDANLEAADEGKIAGLFIMFTAIAAVIIVGISLRSYWAMALTGAGLGILMIWLKGISNLVGIKGGLIIELIVPIAMISLGVDFAVHAIRRYQEEKSKGFAPGQALRIGLVGVLGALTLAMFSDSIAFLSNVSSGIESIIHFGIAATIAVVSSYIVLGVVLPLVMMRIDQVIGPDRGISSTPQRIAAIGGGIGAAVSFGAGIILMVAVNQGLGLLVLVGAIEGFIIVPMLVMNRRNRGREPITEDLPDSIVSAPRDASRVLSLIEDLVVGLPRFAPGLLIITLGVTASAVLLAINLKPTFDVKDFFSSNSDFVVSLDKLDEHVGPRGGEPGIIYIEGDLTDTAALAALQQFVDRLSNNPYVAKDASGEVGGRTRLPSLLRRLTGNDYARAQVQLATGVRITDLDSDGFPDSSEQVKAAYDYMTENGIPLDESTLVFDPSQVRAVLFHDPDGAEENVTTITLGIPGTREQAVV
ncbi:MAG: MMPL family transporter, partial [Chloroflexi bacterium]|nr:MMPL family transporter [Chloroflexota bacterium]